MMSFEPCSPEFRCCPIGNGKPVKLRFLLSKDHSDSHVEDNL